MSKITVIEFIQDTGGKAFVNPASVSFISEMESYTLQNDDGSNKTITCIAMFSWQVNVVESIEEVKRKIFGS
ncbi:MAG: hypothetical protein COB12_12540 [Flavobacterium sp.]|nr:MAG: hypothetical protein COB12_12540 [Flavobacterium sp.]